MKRRVLQFWVFIANTLLEALRNKTLYAVLIAAVLAIAAASVLGTMSLHQDERVFNNLIFFSSMLFLVALSIYQGVTSLHREIDSKTVFTVLSKPVTRGSFLTGKYAASIVILFVCCVLMFGLKIAIALLAGYDITPTHIGVYYAGFLQLTIVIAVAFVFASFSTPLLSALFTFCIFLIGSLTPQLRDITHQFSTEGHPAAPFLEIILWFIPDLEKLNLSYELTHHMEIPITYLVHATGYTATIIIFCLLFAHLIFSRRDFA